MSFRSVVLYIYSLTQNFKISHFQTINLLPISTNESVSIPYKLEGKTESIGYKIPKKIFQKLKIEGVNTMQLHFYTKFEYAQKLQQGEKIQVWTKSEAVKTDIHISLNTNHYTVERVSDSNHIFKVNKIF